MNLARILSDTARRQGAKVAIEFEGKLYTYAEIDHQVERYAAALAELGVEPGDRVAIQLPKRIDFLYLHLATLSVGAITLPLNPDYRPEEVSYFLADSGAALFVTDAERCLRAQPALAELPSTRAVIVDGEPTHGATVLANVLPPPGGVFERPYPTGGDDVAMICYTSGTTGRSKGAMITHANLVSNMRDLAQIWKLSEGDRLLHVLPLFHVHGLVVAAHGALNAGATLVMHERFDPVRAWEAIEAKGCTVLMGVPTVYQRLMNAWDDLGPKPDLSSMRLFISGSAPLSDNLFRRFERATGFRILERYGMTETGMNTSNRYDPGGRVAGSVGYPLPSVEIRIVGEDGKDVVPGEVGEVWIRGANVFAGYWKMPEKTREAFSDGWLRSGDLGRQDPADHGRLYLVGRAKELIISGGYNVYPKEVELVLETHPGVQECAVVGLPDEDFGERVTAAVVPKAGVPRPPEAELIAWCKDKLAGYKCPKQVLYLDELPRNAMGKVQKNRIVEGLGAG